MHTYIAYGLAVSSEFPLAELSTDTKLTLAEPNTDTKSPDVSIRCGHVANLPSVVLESGSWFHTSPQETYLVWEGIVAIKIQNGSEIIVDPGGVW